MNLKKEEVEKLYSKIKKTETCWLWTGHHYVDGYAMFHADGSRPIRVHRAMWSLKNGPIKKGNFICHKCDVRGCVNPAHLFSGTHKENMRDMMAKERSVRGERNGQSKLTPEQVKEIRRIYALGGVSQYKLGDEYGVNQSIISEIVNRVSWRHL